MDIKKFFHAASVIEAAEVYDDCKDGFIIHVDNQLFWLRIIKPHGVSTWGYFELHKKTVKGWELIVPPLIEME
jgi:hypothetical protein